MVSLLLAASLAFTPVDARLAHATADRLVRDHTPRDAGTPRAQLAANVLLDAASATGADVRRDIFKKLAARNYPILMMRSNELSLEEVFLKLTTGDEYGGAEKLETKLDSMAKGADEK